MAKKQEASVAPATDPAAVTSVSAADQPIASGPPASIATSEPAELGRPSEAELPRPQRKKRPGVSPRRGKKSRNHRKNIDQKIKQAGVQPLKQAIAFLKSVKKAKFDETVEVHINLGIDPTQSDQLVRGSVSLPHGLGKTKRVLVFCQGDNIAKAKDAGADFAGGDDLIAKVQNEGFLDFDVAIATQDMMGKVSRLGKVLGPRNLMPTPKAGTVIPANGDVAQAVREQKAGKVEYRSDKSGQVHAGVGKLSFADEPLAANIIAFVEAVRAAKPSGVKGNYINGIVVSATMSPGIPISL
jgi:large subunit ribosomal protein L1